MLPSTIGYSNDTNGLKEDDCNYCLQLFLLDKWLFHPQGSA